MMIINYFTFAEWILIIQAVILFFGLGFTALSIRNSRQDNRRRATVDLILHQRNNKELNQALECISDLVKAEDFPSLHQYLDKDKYPNERKSILDVLNYREFVSVGINTGIIDEEIYKRSYYNIVLRDWKHLNKTIDAIRDSSKGHKTNFQEFEKLARRWERKPLKKFN